MGLLSSRQIIDLSDDSDTDTEDDVSANIDQSKIVSNVITTDAALNESATLPCAETVLDVNKLASIEKQLELRELISLVYLLFDERHFALQQLVLKLQCSEFLVFSGWETKNANWKEKIIEGLCIIKNYKILKELGCEKTACKSHYLPHINSVSLYVNKIRKTMFILAETFDSHNTDTFLQNVRQYFIQKGWDFKLYHSSYIEMFFLDWEIKQYINDKDMKVVTSALKLMDEHHLIEMVETVCTPTKGLAMVTNNHPVSPSPSIYNSHSDFSSIATNSSYNKKSSTSIDNHGRVDMTKELVFESLCLSQSISQANEGAYEIDPNNPGIALIINQEQFYTEVDKKYAKLLPPSTSNGNEKLEHRSGTAKDRDALASLFDRYGYKVFVENNLTHVDMVKRIKEVVKDVTIESSFFLCILSHGDKGVVYAANSCKVKVEQIQNILCKTNKGNLAGKPKVLILQSCQGQECQKINESENESDEDDEVFKDGGNRLVPTRTDVLTFWATVPGYAALRNKKTGSWFIQSLCNKMELFSNKLHFADICTAVIQEVTSKRNHDQAMTPMIVNTFRYPLYLPPLKK